MRNHHQKIKSFVAFLARQQPVASDKNAFNRVLHLQVLAVLLLASMVLFAQHYLPEKYQKMTQQCQQLFEDADYAPSLLRFVQQAVATLAIESHASSAPDGASLASYQPAQKMLLPVENFYISSGYGWREDPLGDAWSFHAGVDFASAEGEAVFAVMDGVVIGNYKSVSYGNCILICHADGSVSVYAHLQYAFARVGEMLVAGAQIGTVGQTGYTTGAHLHFEIRVNNEQYDPSEALGISAS